MCSLCVCVKIILRYLCWLSNPTAYFTEQKIAEHKMLAGGGPLDRGLGLT